MKKGAVLILTFIVMTTLTAITSAFLYMTSIHTKAGGYDIASAKALWFAEAGIQKAVWNLKTPAAGGGQGEDWTTVGTTETLGDGNYTMKVERWDFALAANGSTASADSEVAGYEASKAIDGDDASYWESQEKPLPGVGSFDKSPDITVTFPYMLTINKVRFLVPAGSPQQAPKNYSWQVSEDNVTYTTVFSTINNSATDVTDEFSAASNVRYLRLTVSKIVGGSIGVRIATMEAIGAKVTSMGSAGGMNRQITQTVVMDDVTQTAYDEIDWNEIVPAI